MNKTEKKENIDRKQLSAMEHGVSMIEDERDLKLLKTLNTQMIEKLENQIFITQDQLRKYRLIDRVFSKAISELPKSKKGTDKK